MLTDALPDGRVGGTAPRSAAANAALDTACGQTVEPFQQPAPAAGSRAEDRSAEPPSYLPPGGLLRLNLDVSLADLLAGLTVGACALALAIRTLDAGSRL